MDDDDDVVDNDDDDFVYDDDDDVVDDDDNDDVVDNNDDDEVDSTTVAPTLSVTSSLGSSVVTSPHPDDGEVFIDDGDGDDIVDPDVLAAAAAAGRSISPRTSAEWDARVCNSSSSNSSSSSSPRPSSHPTMILPTPQLQTLLPQLPPQIRLHQPFQVSFTFAIPPAAYDALGLIQLALAR